MERKCLIWLFGILLGLLLIGGCGRAFKYAFAREPKLESFYPRNGATNVERDVRVRFEIWPRNSYVHVDFFYWENKERRWVYYQELKEEKYDTVKYLLIPYEYLEPNKTYYLTLEISAYFDGYYGEYREKIIESSFTTGDWLKNRGEVNEVKSNEGTN